MVTVSSFSMHCHATNSCCFIQVCNIKNEINFHITFACCFSCCFVSHFLWLSNYNVDAVACCFLVVLRHTFCDYQITIWMLLVDVFLLFCVTLLRIIRLQFGCFCLLFSCCFVSHFLWLSDYNLDASYLEIVFLKIYVFTEIEDEQKYVFYFCMRSDDFLQNILLKVGDDYLTICCLVEILWFYRLWHIADDNVNFSRKCY